MDSCNEYTKLIIHSYSESSEYSFSEMSIRTSFPNTLQPFDYRGCSVYLVIVDSVLSQCHVAKYISYDV